MRQYRSRRFSSFSGFMAMLFLKFSKTCGIASLCFLSMPKRDEAGESAPGNSTIGLHERTLLPDWSPYLRRCWPGCSMLLLVTVSISGDAIPQKEFHV